jgi:hypothetical protein
VTDKEDDIQNIVGKVKIVNVIRTLEQMQPAEGQEYGRNVNFGRQYWIARVNQALNNGFGLVSGGHRDAESHFRFDWGRWNCVELSSESALRLTILDVVFHDFTQFQANPRIGSSLRLSLTDNHSE